MRCYQTAIQFADRVKPLESDLAGEIGIGLAQGGQRTIAGAIGAFVDQVAVLNIGISTLRWSLHKKQYVSKLAKSK